MKRKFLVFAEAVGLSLLCAWSLSGCLISAFSLPLTHEGWIIAAWVAWAVLCAGLLLCRWGGTMLLILLACEVMLIALAEKMGLWQQSASFGLQLLGVLGALARVYDAGYGFGIPDVLQVSLETSDFPILALGMLAIFVVSRTVCRRKRCTLPLLVSFGCLAACLVVTDTVPQEQSLFGLLLCVGLLLLTDNVRRENAVQGSKLSAAVVLPLVLALAAVFLCFPQKDYVNTTEEFRQSLMDALSDLPQQLASRGGDILSGLYPRETVQLESLPGQTLLHSPVAEVTADYSGALYLRVQDYDVYTGTAWESSAAREDTLAGSGDPLGNVEIRLLDSQNSLLIPAYPEGQTFLVNGVVKNSEKISTYSVQLRREALGTSPGEQWLALPEDTGKRVRQWLQRARVDTSSIDQTTQEIAALVRQCAAYDRGATSMTGDDFALWFLESGETGYCVHFATTAAVLLRGAGIPARYVTGYLVNVNAGDTVQVTSDNAHAWVEYYNYKTWGWSILEATPGGMEEPTPVTTPPVEATAPAPATTQSTAPTPSSTPPQVPEPTVEGKRTFPGWLAWSILSLLCLPLGLECQRRIRQALRRRQQSRGSNNQRAVAYARELALLARLTGCPVPEEIEELTQKALFSQYSLTPEELRTHAGCKRSFLRRLNSAPWWKKIRCRYWYAMI